MLYPLIRSALFSLDPEDAHRFTLASLDVAHALGLLKWLPRAAGTPVHVMGIDFPNAVGLAAGLDKDGAHIGALADLGFGFGFNSSVAHPWDVYRMRPTMSLAAPSAADARKLIDRGVVADGSNPDGTASLVSTTGKHR